MTDTSLWASQIQPYLVVTLPATTASAAVVQLTTCSWHHGNHHFAVVGEGRTLVLSKAGVECLMQAFPSLGDLHQFA